MCIRDSLAPFGRFAPFDVRLLFGDTIWTRGIAVPWRSATRVEIATRSFATNARRFLIGALTPAYWTYVVDSALSSVRHRVVNDFSLVHALLGMAMRKTSDEQAARLFRASRSRVRVIALLHAVAWRGETGEPSAAEARSYVAEVVREAERARETQGRVRVVLETTGVVLSLSEMAALGLCVSELVLNALEHAFPDGREGVVRVALGPSEGTDDFELHVTDDGVGMPRGASDTSNGIGLSLVRLLAEQLAGSVTWGSTEGQGTDFCLRFASTQESRAWQTS